MRLESTQLRETKPFALGDHCTKAIETVLACDANGTGSYGAVFMYNGGYGYVSSTVHA